MKYEHNLVTGTKKFFLDGVEGAISFDSEIEPPSDKDTYMIRYIPEGQTYCFSADGGPFVPIITLPMGRPTGW